MRLASSILARCLNEPGEASSIAAEQKSNLISRDFELLLEHSHSHQNAKLVAEVAQTTSWCRLWDIALDRGVKGTRGLQTLLRELSRPIFSNSVCNLCNVDLNQKSLWFEQSLQLLTLILINVHPHIQLLHSLFFSVHLLCICPLGPANNELLNFFWPRLASWLCIIMRGGVSSRSNTG